MRNVENKSVWGLSGVTAAAGLLLLMLLLLLHAFGGGCLCLRSFSELLCCCRGFVDSVCLGFNNSFGCLSRSCLGPQTQW